MLEFDDDLRRSRKQQIFTRYVLAVLIDLTVLNLFNQYWDYVFIQSFSISLLAAILLQVLLQTALIVEHRAADYFFGDKTGFKTKMLRILSAWAIIFISKLVILEAINFFFGTNVLFSGPLHGIVSFIVVVTAMIIAEQAIAKIYRSLA
ncbi:MAG: hypothetical protein DRG30_01055 [Epsilonproteobacteria bacterium]|nr:MAG: hypothetical protein DRG30_01055 [Campylobacterota bacterium]